MLGAMTDRVTSDEKGMRCDFCGAVADSVRRVALDTGYDRLVMPHKERYACRECSDQKQRSRGAAPLSGPSGTATP